MFSCDICSKVVNGKSHSKKNILYCEDCSTRRKTLAVKLSSAIRRGFSERLKKKLTIEIYALKYEHTMLSKKFLDLKGIHDVVL